MPTPSTRTPVRIARGSYSNLNGSVSDLQDGEISYAEDQNKLYIKEGSSLVSLTFAPSSPTFTGDVTFTGAAKNVVFDASDNALEFADDAVLRLGADNDLEIFHQSSSTTNFIKTTNASAPIQFQAPAGETLAKLIPNGAVELYHNNSKSFYTTDNGAVMQGYEGVAGIFELHADEGDDNADKWRFVAESGAAQLSIGNYSTGSWVNGLTLDGSNNATFGGEIDIANTKRIVFGHSSGDGASIKHQSGNFEINNDVGNVYFDSAGSHFLRSNGSTTALTLDASQNATFASAIYGPVKTVSALDLNLNTGNYFIKTISGNSTFTFSNPAASGTVTAFTLELTHSSGTVTWPSSVKWNADTPPALTTGKTHLFMFVTDDGGTRYRGSALVDYVN